jgi:hypothetical protein
VLVAASRQAARAASSAVRFEAGMNSDPSGSNDVNVQDGALVHKAPLRPVGRSGASALVSAKDLTTLCIPPGKGKVSGSIRHRGTCARGGTGRRTALRMRRVTPWGFKSLRAHQGPLGGIGRRSGLKRRRLVIVRAPIHAPVAKRPKAPVLHAGIPPFESGREYQHRKRPESFL